MAPGAACLLCRKQGRSCSRVAQVSGSAASTLRRGLEHLGEQAWQRHLAEECVFLNSLLFGVGLAPPSRLSAEGHAVPHCPPTAACAPLSRAVAGVFPAVTPKGAPSQVPGSADSPPLRCGAGWLPHHPFGAVQGTGRSQLASGWRRWQGLQCPPCIPVGTGCLKM